MPVSLAIEFVARSDQDLARVATEHAFERYAERVLAASSLDEVFRDG